MNVVLVSFFALAILAAGTGVQNPPAPPVLYNHIPAENTRSDYFCWDTCTKDVCTPVCAPGVDGKKSPTCNSHGTCNAELVMCECDPHYDGKWCDRCAPGWASTNGTTGFECTVCDKDYYPAGQCNVFCSATYCGPNASGCTAEGRCNCTAGWTGARCDACDYDKGYNDKITGNKVECKKHDCGPYGYAVIYYEGGDDITQPGKPCVCGPPYTYNALNQSCNKCLNDTYSLPLCGPPAFESKVGMAPCKPYSLLLPVLLAVGITLLIIMIIVALFFWCTAKKSGPSHKHDVDMDEPLDSHRDTTYQRL